MYVALQCAKASMEQSKHLCLSPLAKAME